MQYTREGRAVILGAAEVSRAMGHSYVGSTHLLLALVEQPGIPGQLLRFSGLEPSFARLTVSVLWGAGTPGLPLPQSFSRRARLILRGAAEEARHAGSRYVESIHIFLSLLRQQRTGAAKVLLLAGVDREDLFSRAVTRMGRKEERVETMKLLEQFGEDMIAKAMSLEPVIGREREIETVIGIL